MGVFYMLQKVLQHTKIFQQRYVLISDVLLHIESPKKQKKLSTMKEENGNTLQQFEKDVSITDSAPSYKEITITSNNADTKKI